MAPQHNREISPQQNSLWKKTRGKKNMQMDGETVEILFVVDSNLSNSSPKETRLSKQRRLRIQEG